KEPLLKKLLLNNNDQVKIKRAAYIFKRLFFCKKNHRNRGEIQLLINVMFGKIYAMKKFFHLFIVMAICIPAQMQGQSKTQQTREAYNQYLLSHPFLQREPMTKAELKQIPKYDRPDLAWELDYITTMDPATG